MQRNEWMNLLEIQKLILENEKYKMNISKTKQMNRTFWAFFNVKHFWYQTRQRGQLLNALTHVDFKRAIFWRISSKKMVKIEFLKIVA